MIPDKIPAWLAELPGHANLDSKEMAKIFGYKLATSVIGAARDGTIPSPYSKVAYIKHHGWKMLWKASTIRNFIRRHNREHPNDLKQTPKS